MEIVVSGFNFFVLMNLLYEPTWGTLVAHQIGMSTRIVYIFLFAYYLLRLVKQYETKDLVHVGFLWLGLTLVFEWVGSLAIGRPVEEILIGWNIFAGYMWPYVLLTYLLSPLIVGAISREPVDDRMNKRSMWLISPTCLFVLLAIFFFPPHANVRSYANKCR